VNKALVTGAAGFIGSHLVDQLLSENYQVVGVDNLSTGSLSNLNSAIKNSAFNFFERDICDELLDIEGEFDVIFHAASPASPPKYFALPIETMNVNSIGTKNMIEVAIKNSARLIYFSTSEIYGDPLVHPQSEEYFGNVNPIGPRSIYDEAKRFGEALVSQYVREGKLNAGIIRIFNTYGPRLDPFDGRVISTFLRQASNDEVLTINGSGEQTRSFCYISDLVDGILKHHGSYKSWKPI
jgi:nucleoside-diphosphate-sugar epimerase